MKGQTQTLSLGQAGVTGHKSGAFASLDGQTLLFGGPEAARWHSVPYTSSWCSWTPMPGVFLGYLDSRTPAQMALSLSLWPAWVFVTWLEHRPCWVISGHAWPYSLCKVRNLLPPTSSSAAESPHGAYQLIPAPTFPVFSFCSFPTPCTLESLHLWS